MKFYIQLINLRGKGSIVATQAVQACYNMMNVNEVE